MPIGQCAGRWKGGINVGSTHHRSAPNFSITNMYHGARRCATSAAVGGTGRWLQSNPLIGIGSPPTLTTTFGHSASAEMFTFHSAKTSS